MHIMVSIGVLIFDTLNPTQITVKYHYWDVFHKLRNSLIDDVYLFIYFHMHA